jgi:hypothetical protein
VNQYNDENLFLVRNPNVAAFFKTEIKQVFESNALSAEFQWELGSRGGWKASCDGVFLLRRMNP